jgi:hypothetical protein
MRGAIRPLPQYAFMAWCLVKHREEFTLCPFTKLSHFKYTYRALFVLVLKRVQFTFFHDMFLPHTEDEGFTEA